VGTGFCVTIFLNALPAWSRVAPIPDGTSAEDRHDLFFSCASRTQAALAFLVCCGVVGWQAYRGTLSDVTFGLFFGFATAGYIGAKKIASDKDINEQKIDAGIDPEKK
jgi:hypothetical protein